MNFDRFQGPCLFLPGIGVVGEDCRPRTTLVLLSPVTSSSDLHAPQRFIPWLYQVVGWKTCKDPSIWAPLDWTLYKADAIREPTSRYHSRLSIQPWTDMGAFGISPAL